MRLRKRECKEYIFIVIYALVNIFIIGRYSNQLYVMGELAFELLFSLYVFLNHFSRRYEKSEIKKDALKWFKLFFGLQCLFQVYSIFLVIIGKTQLSLLSTNITSFNIVFFSLALILYFDRRAIDVFSSAICLNFILCFIGNLFAFGPSCVGDVFKSNIVGVCIGNADAFEVHNNSFAAGLLFLFYSLKNSKGENHNTGKKIILLMAAFFGQKRIEFVALSAVCFLMLINKLYKHFSRASSRYKMLKILMTCSLFLCFIYVIICLDGRFASILSFYGIHMMGRENFYAEMRNVAWFSPTFLGIGRNAAGHVIYEAFGHIFTLLHNDLLKMYVELGFWLFGAWLFIYIIYIPQKIKVKSSYNDAISGIMLIIFLFLCYLTDNCETYTTVQVGLILSIVFLCNPNRLNGKGNIKRGIK